MEIKLTLHPLVIMNISDQFTRVKAQHDGKEKRIVGAMLGTQEGRNIEIFNSFEVKYDDQLSTGIKHDFLTARLAAYKNLFPNFEFVGWYSNSSTGIPSERDKAVHQALDSFNESPLYLLLNTTKQEETKEGSKKQRELPITLFESVTHFAAGKHSLEFRQLGYNIETEEAERISVDHIAKEVSDIQKGSRYAGGLVGSLNALKMLKIRLQTLLNLVNNSEEVRNNHILMRKFKSICSSLQITTKQSFNEEMLGEKSSAVLVNHLTAMTKIFAMIDDYYNTHNSLTGSRY